TGGAFTPPSPAELSEAFPDLEIVGLLGQGGMGAVYKAVQKKLDRAVALKILPPAVGKDPSFAERFRREAKTLAQLNHPNVVTIHDFGEQGDYFYLLMEFVDGMNLRQMLEMGQLSPAEALDIVPQVCDALQYAHDQGIVHRDIKPENILLDQRGRVHIADFGLAKMIGRGAQDFTLTQSHQRLGTPHYMAPEQVEQPSQVDHRADIFSLGVVFYEMLTGQLPLGRFGPPSATAPVSPDLDPVVMRSLEREPASRYQHASEVKSQVESLHPAARVPAAPGQAPVAASTATQPPRLSKLALFGSLWLMLGCLGGPVFFFSQVVPVQAEMHETLARESAAAERIVEGLESGDLPPGSTPREPSPEEYAQGMQDSLWGPALAWPLMALLFLGLLLGPLLSAFAIPAIRHSGGRLYGIGLAVCTTFMPLLVLVNIFACAPLSLVTSNNVVGVALAVLIPALAALDIWFLVWFTRRMSTP
ncbi:MAG: serine/threonine-protein kinase, partial [Planctomycetota bacterium]